MVQSLWNSSQASEQKNTLEQLVYRSNLIGTDRSVCNWGGGNTSAQNDDTGFSRA